MIWIQAGFAMTVLSAAIKAIPDDIVEAARLDGVGGVADVPADHRAEHPAGADRGADDDPIATLKVFDIVRTTTGGNFDTSVIANEMYKQASAYGNQGRVPRSRSFLFILVIPIVVYNIRQLRSLEADEHDRDPDGRRDPPSDAARPPPRSARRPDPPWRVARRDRHRGALDHPTSACSSPPSGPRTRSRPPAGGRLHRPAVHARELPGRCSAAASAAAAWRPTSINSLVITIPSVLFPIAFASLAAYAFASII